MNELLWIADLLVMDYGFVGKVFVLVFYKEKYSSYCFLFYYFVVMFVLWNININRFVDRYDRLR